MMMFWIYAIIPLILGSFSGWVSSTTGEQQRIRSKRLQPPGWVFSIVWPILYVLMGLAFALVATSYPNTPWKQAALVAFALQLVVNIAWYPVLTVYANIAVSRALSWLLLMLATIATLAFAQVDVRAAVLMVPYVAWLCFATYLSMNFVKN